MTRLCKTKSIVTVNGKFPGPTIVAREGDRVVVNVVNHVQNNITLHWYIVIIITAMIVYNVIVQMVHDAGTVFANC